ncbi:hypothetical protein PJK45_10185 [Mycobacterium kansasii]|nr:hypothetical protein [Mycobacterium kansasii]UCA18163.1 hypothetical protein LA359_18175 [Mycobacterium kansasii]UGU24433.1 hypothetical protein LT351_23875 [Mycobacterium kansasii]
MGVDGIGSHRLRRQEAIACRTSSVLAVAQCASAARAFGRPAGPTCLGSSSPAAAEQEPALAALAAVAAVATGADQGARAAAAAVAAVAAVADQLSVAAAAGAAVAISAGGAADAGGAARTAGENIGMPARRSAF